MSLGRNFERGRFLWPLLATALVLSWSSGFVGIRFANEHASVGVILFWRPFVSGLLLLPIALIRKPRPRLQAIWGQAAYGVMIVVFYQGGFALAIAEHVPTGLVALISDLVPLAIAGLSQLLLGERMTRMQLLGTGIAVVGVIVVSGDTLRLGDAPVWAYAVTFLSMLAFALASVLQKQGGALTMPIEQSLCIQFLTGSLLFGLWGCYSGDILPPADINFVLGIAWLVLISTYLCYAVFYTCLRIYPAVRVSSVIYLSPPVTMVWGWAMFGEPLSIPMLVGLAITMAGVALTSHR